MNDQHSDALISSDPSFAALVSAISDECFAGGAVPDDLARLWFAQEQGDTELLDSFELLLLSGIEPDDALAPFADDADSDPAALAALGRLLREVTFVAEALDSTLLGYWQPPAAPAAPAAPATASVQGAVVVAIDAQGQVAVQGWTFAEALIALTDPDDSDEAAEVLAELQRLGIHPSRCTVEDVLAAVDSVTDPNEVIVGYLLDARLGNPD